MIHAYDEMCLDGAMESLGEMMEYAALDLHLPAEEFYSWFLISGFADRFGSGETAVVLGMSGIELAREVIWKCRQEEIEVPPTLHMDKGPEYWAGWAVAYFQWESALTFRKINEAVPFASILKMYHPYHEMDITQFSDEMKERTESYRRTSSLKRLRRYVELTQRELAEESGVPLRTVQQYEQGQKDLSRAAAETIRRLSAALHCREEDLL